MVFGRQRRSLRAIGGAQLLEAGADMMPGRGGTDHQPFGNLLVAQALDDQRQDLAFAFAQILPGWRGPVLVRISAVVASGDSTDCPA